MFWDSVEQLRETSRVRARTKHCDKTTLLSSGDRFTVYEGFVM